MVQIERVAISNMIPQLFVVLAALASVSAGPSCDDALGGGLCPDAFSLSEMGDCLIAKKSEVDAGCKTFIEIHEKCEAALSRCGPDIPWSPDAIPCVTTWTKLTDLTADCADVVASIAESSGSSSSSEPKELSEGAKKKQEKRKADRKRAVNDVRPYYIV